jgi:arylsulfatase A-like enzyme
MTFRESLWRELFTAVLIGVILSGGTAGAETVDRQPNILLIVADDLGYADVGFQGGRDIPTPHLDSIPANGARFTSGYVSGPYCSPTRAGMLTGRYQQRFGHEFNPPANEHGLPLSEITLADRLKAAGYATGLVGKWHLGGTPELAPQRRGFDEFYGFLGGQHAYFNKNQAVIFRGTEKIVEPDYLTDALGREAVSFIERHENSPFFLYLAFNAVHTPLEADSERLARFASQKDERRKTYAAMLSALDDAVGRVLETLRAKRLEENTLIFFISDNGGPIMPGTTINGSVNTPLRGGKRTTLEGGVRVPFAMQWKGRIPQGIVIQQPVIQLDIQPTALEAAGMKVNPEWKLDGVDLLPFLTGKAQGVPHETLYWRLGAQNAIRHGDWKLVQYDLNADNYPTRGVSEKKLYHLADDIGETRDLAAENPEKVRELEQLWREWNEQLLAPRWSAPNGNTQGAPVGSGK